MKGIKKEIKRLKKQLKTADLIILAGEKRYEENLENLYRQRGKLYYYQKPLNKDKAEQNAPLAIAIVGIAKAINSTLKTMERKMVIMETLVAEQVSRIAEAKSHRDNLKNKLRELKGYLK